MIPALKKAEALMNAAVSPITQKHRDYYLVSGVQKKSEQKVRREAVWQ